MSEEKFITNEGDEGKLVPVEAVPDHKKIKPESSTSTPVVPRKFFCKNCRENYDETQVDKRAIDYGREEDGSLSPIQTRFSVFCPVCQEFMLIIDSDTTTALQEMLKRHTK